MKGTIYQAIKMTEFIEKVVFMDTDVKQLCSKQDLVLSLKLEAEEGWERKEGDEDIDVIAALDGHGKPIVPKTLATFDFNEHFMKTDPIESIQCLLDEKVKHEVRTKGILINAQSLASGSTISFAKIYRNKVTKKVVVKLEWMGDSPIMVFLNGELVFESQLHCAANDDEIATLKGRGVPVVLEHSATGVNVLAENMIESKAGKYFIYAGTHSTAVTRSLGHNRRLGLFESQKHVIECSTDDDLKVIVMSDGVGDMLKKHIDMEKFKTFTATELVELAEKRWKQEWTVRTSTGKTVQYSFPSNGYDDCCAAVWWQRFIEDAASKI